jgi:hypothetical protein
LFDCFAGTAMHALSLLGFFFSDGVDCPFVSALVLQQGVFGARRASLAFSTRKIIIENNKTFRSKTIFHPLLN